jgi:GPH family glycoside/pentoside/hexuronide:cation symporter
VQLMAAFIQVPFTTKLSRAIGKKNAMMISLGIVAFACVLYVFTLTPKHPYWQVVSNFFYGWGIQGVWMMCSTMLADVCDRDELDTGLRQEGIYSSVSSFIMKAALAVGALGSGYAMSLAGFQANVTPTPEVMANLRHLFIWSQIAGLAICASIIWFYPLTRERMTEIRHELDRRAHAG